MNSPADNSSGNPVVRLTGFEKEVLRILLAGVLSAGQVESLVETGEVVGCESTASGYFLTLRHPLLPIERLTLHQPLVMGRAEGIDCGFVVFIENGELTIECHSWDMDLLQGFREMDVKVRLDE